MRYVMTRVLPDPGPARTISGPSKCSTAAFCAGVSKGPEADSMELRLSEVEKLDDLFRLSDRMVVNSNQFGERARLMFVPPTAFVVSRK